MPRREDKTYRAIEHRRHPRSIKLRVPTMRAFWGRLQKVLVLLAALATTAIVVTTVCLFVANNLKVASFIIFLVIGLAVVLWGLMSVSKRHLSFARAFMVLLVSGLFIIVSSVYLDIRSPQDIRSGVMGAFSTGEGQFRSTVDLLVQRTELKLVDVAAVAQETVEEIVEEGAATEYVYVDGGTLVGGDGHLLTLRNNPEATDPSWEELKAFLLRDDTDARRYDIQAFVCADFAEMLHNNAEAAGIRAAFVCIRLGPCFYYPVSGGHALNAFETTDRGLVYIDCTGTDLGMKADKIVEFEVGQDYVPESIFPEPGWSSTWGNVGAVEEIEVLQW